MKYAIHWGLIVILHFLCTETGLRHEIGKPFQCCVWRETILHMRLQLTSLKQSRNDTSGKLATGLLSGELFLFSILSSHFLSFPFNLNAPILLSSVVAKWPATVPSFFNNIMTFLLHCVASQTWIDTWFYFSGSKGRTVGIGLIIITIILMNVDITITRWCKSNSLQTDK